MSPPRDLLSFGSCTLSQDGCATCGDLAVPVRVVRLDGRQALVEDRTGQRATVEAELVPEAAVGDVLLVHMGVAIARPPQGEDP